MDAGDRPWNRLRNTKLGKYLTALVSQNGTSEDSDTKAFSKSEETPEYREFPLPHLSEAIEAVVEIEEPSCRICHETWNGRGQKRLVSPCRCKGSAEFVHKKCLNKWCETKQTRDCEICHSPYQPQLLKAPSLSQSEENLVVSSSLVLCLLFGVFGVSVYLFFAHLAEVNFIFAGDSFLLVFLVMGSFIGFCAFFSWFVKKLRRIIANRRTLLRELRQPEPAPLSVIATST